MNIYVWKYLFEALSAAAPHRDTQRDFKLGAIGVSTDGRKFRSRNLGNPNHDAKCPHVHAEARLCRKLPPNSIVFVARASAAGKPAMAMPCKSCQLALKRAKVRRAYFSTNTEGVYGVLQFN